jgi:hypothetical protein
MNLLAPIANTDYTDYGAPKLDPNKIFKDKKKPLGGYADPYGDKSGEIELKGNLEFSEYEDTEWD